MEAFARTGGGSDIAEAFLLGAVLLTGVMYFDWILPFSSDMRDLTLPDGGARGFGCVNLPARLSSERV